MIHITPKLVVADELLEWRFARSSGPGGQHVNKTASAAQLRFDLGAAELDEPVKRRLRRLAGAKMTDDDVLLIEARQHRSQHANRRAAEERLRQMLLQALRPPKKRRRTRPTAASRRRRLDRKSRHGQKKRLRKPPKME
jgi:ribosome-associated protein